MTQFAATQVVYRNCFRGDHLKQALDAAEGLAEYRAGREWQLRLARA